MTSEDAQAKRVRECRGLASRQGIDALQSANAIEERHYDRALANQDAVLKSTARLMLLLAEARGHKLGPVSHERLTAIAESNPGA